MSNMSTRLKSFLSTTLFVAVVLFLRDLDTEITVINIAIALAAGTYIACIFDWNRPKS